MDRHLTLSVSNGHRPPALAGCDGNMTIMLIIANDHQRLLEAIIFHEIQLHENTDLAMATYRSLLIVLVGSQYIHKSLACSLHYVGRLFQ